MSRNDFFSSSCKKTIFFITGSEIATSKIWVLVTRILGLVANRRLTFSVLIQRRSRHSRMVVQWHSRDAWSADFIFGETWILIGKLFFVIVTHDLKVLRDTWRTYMHYSLRNSRFLSFSKRSRTGGKLRKSGKITLPTSPQFFVSPQAFSFARPLFVRLFDLRAARKRKGIGCYAGYLH